MLAQLPQSAAITSVKLVDILGGPHYQVIYQSTSEQEHSHGDQQAESHTQLGAAATGELRPALTEQEAVQMALNSFVDPVKVAQVEYLTKGNINGHHEYREGALPGPLPWTTQRRPPSTWPPNRGW